MLQEATKALNSAFNNSFIKKLSQYLHDCVREEVKSSTFRNLKADKEQLEAKYDKAGILRESLSNTKGIPLLFQQIYLKDVKSKQFKFLYL